MSELQFLKDQGVSENLIQQVREFREKNPVPEEAKSRLVKPSI
ncbi:hypothetical protein EVA_14529, partial [gut metagenome]